MKLEHVRYVFKRKIEKIYRAKNKIIRLLDAQIYKCFLAFQWYYGYTLV